MDLMVPYEDPNAILDALDSVLQAYQEAKVKVAKDVLLLRYVWLDVDKVSLPFCCIADPTRRAVWCIL